MRLVDADKVAQDVRENNRANFKNPDWSSKQVCTLLENAPTVDALPLRCHFGDEVWVVGTKCMSGLHDHECPDKNEWYSFDDFCEDCPLDRENIVFPRRVSSLLFAFIHDLEHSPLFRWGETVFKTREEAEAALAERKINDGC